MLTRRAVLTVLATATFQSARVHSAEIAKAPLRVACMDWMAAETLLSLGVVPAGVIDVRGYGRTVAVPVLPSSVVDLGAGWAPNIEVLQKLAPDLLMLPQWTVELGPIDRIAPSSMIASNLNGMDRITTAKHVLPALAEQVVAPIDAQTVISRFDAQIAIVRERLASFRHRPICYAVLNPNGRHVTIAARGSLMDDVFRVLGLSNAWTGEAPEWGLVMTGIEQLFRLQDAHLMYVDEGERTLAALRTLSRSRIWNSLPVVSAGQVSSIPPIYFYGGLQSAARFARLVSESLLNTDG